MRSPGRIYKQILERSEQGKKQLAVLVDPDKSDGDDIKRLADVSNEAGVDYFFAGGSLLTGGTIDTCVSQLKSCSDIPVILFPGSAGQLVPQADALLFLSLISGRNPDLLIGHHVTAAPFIKKYGIETISTGYILIESGGRTTVQYISNTIPIPADKPDIAACTALAGELLGMSMIFAEAGSGAEHPVSAEIIGAVRNSITVPLITGGGIRTTEKAVENCRAGADIIVIGNSLENNPDLIRRFADAIHAC